jgi:hypothetical protein
MYFSVRVLYGTSPKDQKSRELSLPFVVGQSLNCVSLCQSPWMKLGCNHLAVSCDLIRLDPSIRANGITQRFSRRLGLAAKKRFARRGPVNLVQNTKKRLQRLQRTTHFAPTGCLDFVLQAALELANLSQPLSRGIAGTFALWLGSMVRANHL